MNTRHVRTAQYIAFAIAGLISTTLTADAAKPNILVIITDEHNFRTLGCYREQLSREQGEMWGEGVLVETPNIDRLAHRGLIGMRAYATAPVCTPCRAAMITGRYPQNTGAPTNDMELRSDIPTLATVLAANGYETTFIGKWHLAGVSKPGWAPQIDGGFQNKTFMFNRGHWKKLIQTDNGPAVGSLNRKNEPDYGVNDADNKTFATDFLADRVIDSVEDATEKPFLTVVSFPDPHGPNTVRAPYDHQYDNLRFQPPRTYGITDATTPNWLGAGKKHEVFRGPEMSRYFGMVKCIDDNIGRILAKLESTGKLDSTLIVFTSDHGDLCYEHDRLNKGNPYEGSARVPMLISYPPLIKQGKVYTQPIGTVDVTPTILGLVGISTDASFEGRNLAPWITVDELTDTPSSKTTFLRNAGTTPAWLAAVDNRYKLIVSINDQPWLFDSETDPDELLNFFGRPGTNEVTKRLASALRAYGEETNDAFVKHAKIQAGIATCLGE